MILLAALSTASAVEVCPVCPFQLLSEAVEAIGAGESVEISVLSGNYVESSTIAIPPGATVRITAVGAVTLTNAAAGAVLSISGDDTLLTVDSFTFTAVGDRIIDVNGGRVEIYNSVLYMLGVVEEGGAVYVGPGASFYARDALFLDNVATATGGHMLVRDGEAEIVNCRLSGGYARRGGAISIVGEASPAALTVSGSTFEGNLAAEIGGALAVSGAASVTITDSLFEDNAADLGGAIADATLGGGSANVVIEHTSFSNNTADQYGGAISIEGGAYTLRDCTLAANSANSGGAIWIGSGTAGLERNLLCENTARNMGGAIATASALPQVWFNNRLVENSANSGGAIEHAGGTLELRNTSFLGNAGQIGGALHSNANVVVRSSLVAFNEGSTALVAHQVQENWNAFWENAAGDVQEENADEVIFGGNIHSDPRLERYQPRSGCDTLDDFYSWYGPLRGGADPFDAPNPDGSHPADIGAFGGDRASASRWEDTDGDGYPKLYDCVEGDPSFHPEANDVPYDGIDRNCDLANDYDVDGDGFSPPEDCDDYNATTYPGARELPDRGDQNCDGRADADGDGYSPPEDCDDGDDRIHPGAAEDPGVIDLDCMPPFDVSRPLRPRSCAVLPHDAAPLATLLAAFAAKRRRRG